MTDELKNYTDKGIGFGKTFYWGMVTEVTKKYSGTYDLTLRSEDRCHQIHRECCSVSGEVLNTWILMAQNCPVFNEYGPANYIVSLDDCEKMVEDAMNSFTIPVVPMWTSCKNLKPEE